MNVLERDMQDNGWWKSADVCADCQAVNETYHQSWRDDQATHFIFHCVSCGHNWSAEK